MMIRWGLFSFIVSFIFQDMSKANVDQLRIKGEMRTRIYKMDSNLYIHDDNESKIGLE